MKGPRFDSGWCRSRLLPPPPDLQFVLARRRRAGLRSVQAVLACPRRRDTQDRWRADLGAHLRPCAGSPHVHMLESHECGAVELELETPRNKAGAGSDKL